MFPIYETYPESEIKDNLETVNNPFESNESIFLAIETRKQQWTRGKRRDRPSNKHQDPDIQTEIDKALAVNILYDTSR